MYKEGEGKEASKEGFALIFSSGKNAITYSKINDSTGILTIKDFTSSLVRRLLTGTDPGFPKKLSKAMKQIRKDGVKHLIIDLRDNTGGYIYNAYELMSYFTDEKFAAPVIYKITDRSRKLAAKMLKREYKIFYGKQRHPDILRSMEIFKSMPDGSVFRSDTVLPMQYPPKPEEYRYRGKTYLLTNGLTYSASIMFTNLFKTYTAGLLAGESPGGYSVVFSGDAPIVELPCSNMWLNMTFFSTGTDRKYKYIEPDIPIEPTLEEWLYGKHDSLEKLLAMIMENKISRE
jgi:C-terminal processing protease CtpA/Prc